MNCDLVRPGAPAGEDSRKLRGDEDMLLTDASEIFDWSSGHYWTWVRWCQKSSMARLVDAGWRRYQVASSTSR